MADRYLKWLLSGGIGSGKSEVRRLLERHGLMTIDADRVGHEVLFPGGAAAADVAGRWPQIVVDGKIDRNKLGEIVFADEAQLSALESLTHPHIFEQIKRRIGSTSQRVVVEIPLLIQPFDEPWPRIVVDAPDDLRRQRVIDRGARAGDVERRMAVQPSRSQYLAAADVIIPNRGNLQELRSAVELLANEMLLASESKAAT